MWHDLLTRLAFALYLSLCLYVSLSLSLSLSIVSSIISGFRSSQFRPGLGRGILSRIAATIGWIDHVHIP